jgi:hypothetical protein
MAVVALLLPQNRSVVLDTSVPLAELLEVTCEEVQYRACMYRQCGNLVQIMYRTVECHHPHVLIVLDHELLGAPTALVVTGRTTGYGDVLRVDWPSADAICADTFKPFSFNPPIIETDDIVKTRWLHGSDEDETFDANDGDEGDPYDNADESYDSDVGSDVSSDSMIDDAPNDDVEDSEE